MKTLNKKNLFVVILTFIFALSMFVFAGTATVFAETTETTETTTEPERVFELVDTASIRIGSGDVTDTGIRFQARVNQTVYDEIVTNDGASGSENKVKLGFIITAKAIFDEKRTEGTATDDTVYTKTDYIYSVPAYVGDDLVGIQAVDKDTGADNLYDGGDGYYYANAAVTKIQNTVDFEYTAIAYIYNSEGASLAEKYEYALIEDYSATIVDTASKVYLNDLSEMEDLQKVQGMSTFGTTQLPVLINDSDDMYAISDLTVAGEDFSDEEGNAYQFKLNANVTVDCDFTPISTDSATGFNGEFVESENKVTIINGGTAFTHIFDGATTENGATEDSDAVLTYKNVKCVPNFSLFTATENVVDRLSNNKSANAEFVDAGRIVPDEVDNTVNYDKNAVKWTSVWHNHYLYVKLNYDKKEIEELSAKYGFNAVKINYLYDSEHSIRNNDQGSEYNIMSSLGYARISNLSSSYTGANKVTYGADYVVRNEWQTKVVPIDEFLNVYSQDQGAYKVTFVKTTSTNSADYAYDVYLGDLDLVQTEDPILFYNGKARQVLFGINSATDIITTTTVTDSEGAQVGDAVKSIVTDESASYRTPTNTLVTRTAIPTVNYNLATDATDVLGVNIEGTYDGIDVIKQEIMTDVAYYAKLRYNKESISKMRTGNKYTHIRIVYMLDVRIDSNGDDGWTLRESGVLKVGDDNSNKWMCVDVPIEEFVLCMGHQVAWTQTTTNSDYASTTEDTETGNTTTVTAENLKNFQGYDIDEYSVLLNYGLQRSVTNLYLAEIKFVNLV